MTAVRDITCRNAACSVEQPHAHCEDCGAPMTVPGERAVAECVEAFGELPEDQIVVCGACFRRAHERMAGKRP